MKTEVAVGFRCPRPYCGLTVSDCATTKDARVKDLRRETGFDDAPVWADRLASEVQSSPQLGIGFNLDPVRCQPGNK
jgi:hypothetical protein